MITILDKSPTLTKIVCAANGISDPMFSTVLFAAPGHEHDLGEGAVNLELDPQGEYRKLLASVTTGPLCSCRDVDAGHNSRCELQRKNLSLEGSFIHAGNTPMAATVVTDPADPGHSDTER